jgi:hypothetical protein
LFETLARRFAVWRYRTVLPYALVRRYGRSPSYKPAQVLATIRATGLSQRHAVYACALFCSKRAVREHVEKHGEHLTFDNPSGLRTPALLGFSLLSEYDNLRAQIGVPSDGDGVSDSGGWPASAWGGGSAFGGEHDAGGDGGAAEGGSDGGGGDD